MKITGNLLGTIGVLGTIMFNSTAGFSQTVRLDLLIGDNNGVSKAYQNTGTCATPVWTAQPAWNTPYAFQNHAPGFGDLDNDGDYDLMMGTGVGTCLGYRNTGSGTSPSWSAEPTWNIASIGTDTRPFLIDLDSDGDLDAVLGRADGDGVAFENTGTITTPVFTSKPAWNTPDVGQDQSPAFADLDDDGDYDLLAGEDQGNTLGYRNTGNSGSPVWTRHSAWDIPDIGSDAAPTIGRVDCDSDYDVLVGEDGGKVFGYRNSGSASSPTWTYEPAWYMESLGSNTQPILLDLDEGGASLPVEMVSLSAAYIIDCAVVNWATTFEIDSDHFVLEKSPDGIIWQEAGRTDAAVLSFSVSHYELRDCDPISGPALYRLWQVDLDGGSRIVGMVRLVVPLTGVTVSLHQDDHNGGLVMTATSDRDVDLEISLSDMSGKSISRQTLAVDGSGVARILLARELATGVYVVSWSDHVSHDSQVVIVPASHH